ncbi:MAG: hypothetical protein ACRDMZ_23725, partial [Solirubrobacteraceae bacterium]
MSKGGEDLAAAAARAASASAEAYERFAAQARAVVAGAAAAATQVVERAEAAVDQIPAAAEFRHGVIRLLACDDDDEAPGAEAADAPLVPDCAAPVADAASASAYE